MPGDGGYVSSIEVGNLRLGHPQPLALISDFDMCARTVSVNQETAAGCPVFLEVDGFQIWQVTNSDSNGW